MAAGHSVDLGEFAHGLPATGYTWKIRRDCRLDGVHHAMLGITRMHNLALAG